ncbi:MAG: hypothetical protein K8I29_00410 [Alphaproteobacteria bacterium]|uniref:Uncharacterized protein n=1 Tax=Candidatus Nitrobium versatile TaxID=2884831 RepID=A0A953J1R0_9BACT|nr:hypothetical protein [Candidatus Nitrobium versatile]
MRETIIELSASETRCPYYSGGLEICTASCSSMGINVRMKLKYCGNEDYDDCPLFLAKGLLRG